MRKCFGVGICDNESPIQIEYKRDGKRVVVWRCPYYQLWMAMLRRCYRKEAKNPSDIYFGVEVWEGWHRFSTFTEWVKGQDQHSFWLNGDVTFALDKDILSSQGCATKYHPETSVLIPQGINSIFTSKSSIRGKYPLGVFYKKKNKKFQSQIMVNGVKTYLELFEDPMEGHRVWQEAKIKNFISTIEDYSTKPYKDSRVIDKMLEVVARIQLDILSGKETVELLGE